MRAKVIQHVNVYFRFLPRLARAALDRGLDRSSIHDTVESDESVDLSCKLQLSEIYRISLRFVFVQVRFQLPYLQTYLFNIESDFIAECVQIIQHAVVLSYRNSLWKLKNQQCNISRINEKHFCMENSLSDLRV